jgi:hypothetical protein
MAALGFAGRISAGAPIKTDHAALALRLGKKAAAILASGFHAARGKSGPVWPRLAERRQIRTLKLYFLLKCAFWLGLVLLAMPWGQHAAPHPPGVARLDAKGQAVAPPRETGRAGSSSLKDTLAPALMHTATGKLASVAREHCLSHVSDCLSLLGAAADVKDKRGGR